MHKPLSCIKGQVRPCRLGDRVLLCPWLGLVFLSLLPSWGGAGGWARFRGVGLVGGSGVLFLVDYGFLMMNPQGEHYIHMHAVSGVWWRVPGGAGAGAAWVVESWPRALARDLRGCGGSDRQESTR